MLNQHLKIHNPDPLLRRPIPCPFSGCEFRARHPSKLNRNMNVRHKPKRVKDAHCPFCPKYFFNQSNLNFLLKVDHLKEKGYKCDNCSYNAVSESHLKRNYERVHDGCSSTVVRLCKSCGILPKSKFAFHSCKRRSHPNEEQLMHHHEICPVTSFSMIQAFDLLHNEHSFNKHISSSSQTLADNHRPSMF